MNTTAKALPKLLTEAAALRLPKSSTKAKDLWQIEGHLWLQHTGEAKSFLYMVNAKALQKTRIEVGLGSWQVDGDSNYGEGRVTRTWTDARTRTLELDRELKKGQHPKEIERAFRESKKAKKAIINEGPDDGPDAPPKAKQLTVRQLVVEFIDKSSTTQEWIGKKTLGQFQSTMKNYVYPLIGDRLVHTIEPDDIFAILTQVHDGEIMWKRIHRQAIVMRQRLETMFNYAKAEKHRRANDSSNPASWQHFAHRLARSSKVHVVKPHAHVKPEGIADIYRKLGMSEKSQAANALRLKILTVPRTAAIIEAKWSEFDFDKQIWTIPGARMKGDLQRKSAPFVIPLSTAALAVLEELPGFEKREGYLFPVHQKKRSKVLHLSYDSMRVHTYRIGLKGILAPHGVRHVFSTWRADETEFASELAEACLAHANGEGSKTAASYNQGTYLKRRREVMEAWGAYVTAPPASNVVDITKRARKAA